MDRQKFNSDMTFDNKPESDQDSLDSIDLYIARVKRRQTGPMARDIEIIWPATPARDLKVDGIDERWADNMASIECKRVNTFAGGTEKVMESEFMIKPKNFISEVGCNVRFVLLGYQVK